MRRNDPQMPITVNVFITHKHATGMQYLEKVKRIITECAVYAPKPVKLNFVTDKSELGIGDSYDDMEEYYNCADIEVIILSGEMKTSKWPIVEIYCLKDRGIPVLPILCEGTIEDNYPECLDDYWLDMTGSDSLTEDEKKQIGATLGRNRRRSLRNTYRKYSERVLVNGKLVRPGSVTEE